jgi:putative endonuclease
MMQMEMRLEGGRALTARPTRRMAAHSDPPSPIDDGTLQPEQGFDGDPLNARSFSGGVRGTVTLRGEEHGMQVRPSTTCKTPPKATSLRAERGRRGYHTGLAAEDIVARHYAQDGHVIEARRWRGPGGEVDMIIREGARLVFVEVKASRSFDAAIAHLTRRQMDRICRSAEAYCGEAPDGLMTEMRFDLALVDGRGAVRVIENAFDGG